jgi:NCS2 family nucleobase:cation symporter-2
MRQTPPVLLVTDQQASHSDIAKYGIDDKPPLREAVPLGIQHVFAMFLGNVAPPLILAGAIGLSTGNTTFLVQMALIVAGLATILQAYPVGPVGGGLPIVMGTSFAFLGAMLNIGNQFGIAAVFGAGLIGAFVEFGFGAALQRFRPYFPPLVTSVVVILIGLTLVPVGLEYAAGGAGSANFGSLTNLAVAGLVMVVTIYFNQFFEGLLRVSAVFVGILVGYAVSVPLGLTDFSAVAQAGWITVPTPLKFGIAFEPSAILLVSFIYVAVTMESIGNISAIVSVSGRDATMSELRGGVVADAVASAGAALLNAMPNTAFAQNVGLINLTGVASRYVAAIGGVVLVVLGFVPKIGAIVSAMPDAVLGGGALIMFGMIFSSGLGMIDDEIELTHRNRTILAISVGLGVAVTVRPDAFASLPASLQPLLEEGVFVGGLSAIVLNWALPGGCVGVGPTDDSAGVVSFPDDGEEDPVGPEPVPGDD